MRPRAACRGCRANGGFISAGQPWLGLGDYDSSQLWVCVHALSHSIKSCSSSHSPHNCRSGRESLRVHARTPWSAAYSWTAAKLSRTGTYEYQIRHDDPAETLNARRRSTCAMSRRLSKCICRLGPDRQAEHSGGALFGMTREGVIPRVCTHDHSQHNMDRHSTTVCLERR